MGDGEGAPSRRHSRGRRTEASERCRITRSARSRAYGAREAALRRWESVAGRSGDLSSRRERGSDVCGSGARLGARGRPREPVKEVAFFAGAIGALGGAIA